MTKKMIIPFVALASCFALIPASVASGSQQLKAAAIKPALCEHKCGESEGAYERAKAYAEEAWPETAHVQECLKYAKKEKAGETQWKCTGYYGSDGPEHFHVYLGPFGDKTQPTELYT